MNVKQKKVGCDMIYLAGCAANSITPDREKIESMDLKAVYIISRSSGLLPLTWRAIELAQMEEVDFLSYLLERRDESYQDILQQWREARERAVMRGMLFDSEREKIYAFLEKNDIWYMPLKGIVIKDFYPERYLRTMVDNDILYDPDFQKQVHQWFLKQGYKVYQYKLGNVDCYQKKPVYNFEMHTSLFGTVPNQNGQEINELVTGRRISVGDGSCRYYLSDEDFYLYFLFHMYKHSEKGGIGIRSLMDCYLYIKSKGDCLDWKYIQAELSRLGMVDYERIVRTLSWKMFSNPEGFSLSLLSEDEEACFEDFLSSCNYGTPEHYVRKELQSLEFENEDVSRWAKFRFLWKQAFPNYEYMAAYSQVLAKFKWLIPFGYIYRIFRGLKKWPGVVKAELRTLRKM